MGTTPSAHIKKDRLDELHDGTHFAPKELKALFKQFKKETPEGAIQQEEFREAMSLMGVVNTFLQDLIFNVFDQNKDGVITFDEFVKALSTMSRGNPTEKLKFAFEMYDLDNSGYITKDEMERIVDSFYQLVGPLEECPLATFTGKTYDSPQELVNDVFAQMDKDGDGRISLTEYQDGATKNPDVLQGLKLFE